MRFRFDVILFLSISIFLICQSIFASDQEVRISDADEEWTAGVGQIDQGAIDSSNATVTLPKEAIVCHADEVWSYGLEAPSHDAVDSSNVVVKLPKEAVVCHADEVWSTGLASSDIGSGPSVNDKTPVLFDPGVLGTKIKDSNDNFLWVDPDRMINPLRPDSGSDAFMDPLAFEGSLLPKSSSLLLGDVIKDIKYARQTSDYTKSLVDQFIGLGYAENKDFFLFPYDWRYGASGVYPDGKTNSVLLKEKIDDLAKKSPTGKVDVIAHSLGGLVTKKYIIDNDNPKIGKLVFVGVPNLGSPRAVQVLLPGTDFGIFGLNPQELKKISQNMPAVYDLLPTKGYYTEKGSYLSVEKPGKYEAPEWRGLNYEESLLHLKILGLNKDGLTNSDDSHLHTVQFDYFDARTKGVDVYNIAACQTNTFRGLFDYQEFDSKGNAKYEFMNKKLSGDDTVPFESADSIPADDAKKFYFKKIKHGDMPSADGIRQEIASIIVGIDYPKYNNLITHDQLAANHSLCELSGDNIIVKSPVDITVVDGSGHIVLGVDSDGNTHYEIPGASFEIMGGHKYVYLPADMGTGYKIALKGTDTGTFTLVDQKIEGDAVKSAEVFNDVPVTPEFGGTLAIDGAIAQIKPVGGAVINPTSEINGGASEDIIPPYSTTTISGLMGKAGFYRSDVTVNLSARDFAQQSVTASEVFSMSYRLDGSATTTVQIASTTINVAAEGKHSLAFSSSDKLGNKGEPQTINFVIDKTAPEIGFKFDQTKKDLLFFATDNYSATSTIAITDQNGSVTVTDEAGNTMQLTFVEKNRMQSLRAQLSGLSYNGKTIDMAGNQVMLAWFYGYTPQPALPFPNWQALPKLPAPLPNSGSLTYLLQQAKLKDGSLIVAIYSGNTTKIYQYKDKKFTTQTLSGLKLVNFETEAGRLKWAW